MNKQINISDAEWKVMCVLWRNNPLKSREIIRELKDTKWNPNTIHTLLSRLEKKEIIGVKKTSRFKEYYPLISKKDCQLHETNTFMKKVYSGSIKMFLSNYISPDNLSEDDLKYLKDLINNKENIRNKKND